VPEAARGLVTGIDSISGYDPLPSPELGEAGKVSRHLAWLGGQVSERIGDVLTDETLEPDERVTSLADLKELCGKVDIDSLGFRQLHMGAVQALQLARQEVALNLQEESNPEHGAAVTILATCALQNAYDN